MGAAAVVDFEVAPYTLVAGNPGRVMRRLEPSVAHGCRRLQALGREGEMIVIPNVHHLVPTTQMRGDSEEDTALLRGMLEEAEIYLKSHEWCPLIAERYFGCGVGGVVAAFLFTFSERLPDDDALWVVVGDVPSAYFVVDNAHDPKSALEVYCALMDQWVMAVRSGRSLSEAYPVAAEPTLENASKLAQRLVFIRKELIPICGRTKKAP